MAKLYEYLLDGLLVEEHEVCVPLRWDDLSPQDYTQRSDQDLSVSDPEIKVFYRLLRCNDADSSNRPVLIYFQGGPGSGSPRITSRSDIAWIDEALNHYQVLLIDQRGCGRSNPVDARMLAGYTGVDERAAFLKCFLTDSIVKDFEYIRLKDFQGQQFVSLGQSFGGFITLSYLSLFPGALKLSFVCGGIPHVPASAVEVYEHTTKRMIQKNQAFYESYPHMKTVVARVRDWLATHEVTTLNGSRLTPEFLQLLGVHFGMGPGFERMVNFFDGAFVVDPATGNERLSEVWVEKTYALLTSADAPLYWVLQEFIYADGVQDEPIAWAAERMRATHPELAPEAHPLFFIGESALSGVFEADTVLRPFKEAVEYLMQESHFDRFYNEAALAENTTPLYAAVYFDDLFVDAELQLDTLSRVGASHRWVTSEFEHDGLRNPRTFKHLMEMARQDGNL